MAQQELMDLEYIRVAKEAVISSASMEDAGVEYGDISVDRCVWSKTYWNVLMKVRQFPRKRIEVKYRGTADTMTLRVYEVIEDVEISNKVML